MFMYHFTGLIKSKLLWGFLALLMVFAFVVMDSCSGRSSMDQASGYLNKKAIDRKTAEDAAQVGTLLTSNTRFYLPQNAQIFGALLTTGQAPETWPQRQRMNWKMIAAQQLADQFGLTVSLETAQRGIETMFAGRDHAFNPAIYRAFLSANNYSDAHLFEDTYKTMWFPAETLTMATFNAIGWASPMEQAFVLANRYDKTTAFAATLKNKLDPATLTVSTESLQNWYKSHSADYTLPDQREISYVEIPVKTFGEKIEIAELDAMQYYDDHNEEFQGTDTNGVSITLPFDNVKEKAIANLRNERAREAALVYATETLVTKVQQSSLQAVGKDYGEVKTLMLTEKQPIALQNGTDIVQAVFEMDPVETPCDAIAGKDVVYLFHLNKVIPSHLQALEAVKKTVEAAVRNDLLAKRVKTNGETLRATLLQKLAETSDFEKAVAACKIESLTATTGMTFVVSAASDLKIDHRAQVLATVDGLGVKALSEPVILDNNEILLVYVADRQPGDPLAKATARPTLGQSLTINTAFQVTSDWLTWNLERNPPVVSLETQVPVLVDEDATDE